MLRHGIIAIWQSRGGGLYGLGYVLTFIVLEIQEIPELVSGIAGLFNGESGVMSQLFALLVDHFSDALRNMIYAFIWPALVLKWLGGYGVLLLAVGFAGFNRFLRPLIERLLPELKDSEKDEPGSEPETGSDPLAESKEPTLPS